MHKIKLYGERNSGTNYLEKLITLNLNVHQMRSQVPWYIVRLQKIMPDNEILRDLYFQITFRYNLGWKHTLVPPSEVLQKYVPVKSVSFVTITKNPYSWLLSMHARPHHYYDYAQRTDFETFLTSRWHTLKRDNTPYRVVQNPIVLWNIKNASYISLAGSQPTVTLRFEDLLAAPADAISCLADRFFLSWKNERFQAYEQSTKGDYDKNTGTYRDYYLNERWRNRLSSNAIKIINQYLDPKVVEYFGYDLLPHPFTLDR